MARECTWLLRECSDSIQLSALIDTHSLTTQRGYRVLHGRSYRLETDRYRRNDQREGRRRKKNQRADGDPVVITCQPLMQEIIRYRRSYRTADAHQQDKITRQQQQHLAHRRAQYFADADLPGALLGRIGRKPQKPKTGDKDRQRRENP